ncbi:MAG: hypothetical protein WBO39_00995 [Ferruginibacter sp.]
MQIIPVTDNITATEFIQTSVVILKNDPSWVRPLDKDINEVFDKTKNKAFRFGEITRWILKDDSGNLIGRIAAFINKKYKSKGDDVPVGGIGFFECINNQEAADLLFDNAKQWLIQKGMEAMDGPINFGERDRWWGLITKGFTPPLYCMNYNPPYYVTLFENYGFKLFYNQVCFAMEAQKQIAQKTRDRHKVLDADPDISCETIKKNNLEKYANDFVEVYNKAWAGHGGLKQMNKDQVLLMFKTMKPVMDESITYFAYHKGTAIGMFINMPDINQYFKHMNGKFGLLQKLEFLWRQKFRPARKFVGLVFGIVPEWQGKGIDSYIIGECQKLVQVPPYLYQEYEIQWIGDFNPKMINVAESFGDTYRSRNLVTYRYLFDRTKEFKRHPILT